MARRNSGGLKRRDTGDAFRAPVRSPVADAGRRSGVSTHLAWAGGGFLLGAICWHMVGFWSFVDRVLDETGHPSLIAISAQPAEKQTYSRSKTTDRLVSMMGENDCVQRVATGAVAETIVRPCALPVVAMQHGLLEQ